MKDFISNSSNIRKIEFWAATTIYILAVLFLITGSLGKDLANVWAPNKAAFIKANVPFQYYQNYLLPQLVPYTFFYLAFLILNFIITPKIQKKEALTRNIFFICLLFMTAGLLFGTTDTYLRNFLFSSYGSEEEAYEVLFQNGFIHAFRLLLLFGFYYLIRESGIFILSNAEAIHQKYPFFTPGRLAAAILWLMSTFILLIMGAEGEVVFL